MRGFILAQDQDSLSSGETLASFPVSCTDKLHAKLWDHLGIEMRIRASQPELLPCLEDSSVVALTILALDKLLGRLLDVLCLDWIFAGGRLR